MSIEKFCCESCYLVFRAQSSFWLGYKAICPRCGAECEAVTEDTAPSVFAGMDVDAPLFETEESTKEDLESGGDVTGDEISEALAQAATEVDDTEIGDNADADGDADGAGDANSA